MPDRENVITHLQIIHTWAEFARERDLQFFTPKHLEDIAQWSDDALALLKEQEAEKEALASLASLADHRRERVGKVLYDLCELGYPHNFQHEAPWVVDYLYKLTAIIKRAYEVKNNDDT